MTFLRDFFGKLNKDELIFDALVVVSSITIQELMFNKIIVIKELPSAVPLIFGFVFAISLSFMMGIYFAKYKNEPNSRKMKSFPAYMAWLIFPGILSISVFSVIIGHFSDNVRNIFIFLFMFLILISTIGGSKVENRYYSFKEKIIKTLMYFSAVTLSVVEAVMYMGKSMSKHPDKDTLAMVLALVLLGYVPYRLVIAFAPPVNKRNLIFALLGILITSGYTITA